MSSFEHGFGLEFQLQVSAPGLAEYEGPLQRRLKLRSTSIPWRFTWRAPFRAKFLMLHATLLFHRSWAKSFELHHLSQMVVYMDNFPPKGQSRP